MRDKNEPWQIAAARFCVEKGEFTVKEFEEFMQRPPYQIPLIHVRNFFIENIQNPAGRTFNRDHRNSPEGEGGYWTAPSDLVSKVTDYDELREARQSSKKAMRIASASLILATIVGVSEILVQIFF